MDELKYQIGDKVRIKSLDWYNENKDEDGTVELSTHIFTPGMSQFCGKVMTIEDVFEDIDDNVVYYMEEIDYDWTDEMIECRLPAVSAAPKFQIGDVITDGRAILTILSITPNKYVVQDNFEECALLPFHSQDGWELLKEFDNDETYDFLKTDKPYPTKPRVEDFLDMFNDTITLPQGFVFRDQNGNIIDATKIVLEKKKNEYPKTYDECCKVLGYDDRETYCVCHTGANERLFESLYRLKVCRDAYWQIAGQEMGLNRPWEPDWEDYEHKKFVFIVEGNTLIEKEYSIQRCFLAFPTEEIRDAFYENFEEDIEFVKELL